MAVYIRRLESFDTAADMALVANREDTASRTKWTYATGIPTPEAARTGGYGLAPDGLYGKAGKRNVTFPDNNGPQPHGAIGKAMRNVTGFHPASGVSIVAFADGPSPSDVHVVIKTAPNGALAVYSGTGVLLGTSAFNALPLSGWFSFQACACIAADATGYVMARVNGTVVLNVSSVSTRYGPSGDIYEFEFGAPLGFHVDDLYWGHGVAGDTFPYFTDLQIHAMLIDGYLPSPFSLTQVSGAVDQAAAIGGRAHDDDSSYIALLGADDERKDSVDNFTLTDLPPFPVGTALWAIQSTHTARYESVVPDHILAGVAVAVDIGDAAGMGGNSTWDSFAQGTTNYVTFARCDQSYTSAHEWAEQINNATAQLYVFDHNHGSENPDYPEYPVTQHITHFAVEIAVAPPSEVIVQPRGRSQAIMLGI